MPLDGCRTTENHEGANEELPMEEVTHRLLSESDVAGRQIKLKPANDFGTNRKCEVGSRSCSQSIKQKRDPPG